MSYSGVLPLAEEEVISAKNKDLFVGCCCQMQWEIESNFSRGRRRNVFVCLLYALNHWQPRLDLEKDQLEGGEGQFIVIPRWVLGKWGCLLAPSKSQSLPRFSDSEMEEEGCLSLPDGKKLRTQMFDFQTTGITLVMNEIQLATADVNAFSTSRVSAIGAAAAEGSETISISDVKMGEEVCLKCWRGKISTAAVRPRLSFLSPLRRKRQKFAAAAAIDDSVNKSRKKRRMHKREIWLGGGECGKLH